MAPGTDVLVPLSQGLVAVIDEADAEAVLRFKWSASFDGRRRTKPSALRATYVDGVRSTVTMHRQIMGLSKGDGLEVDHLDFDRLNNRRSNLLVVTGARNKQRQPARAGSSQFVGVTWDLQRGLWRAQIQVDGTVVNLGRFKTEREAADARDRFVVANELGHQLNHRESA